METKKEIEKRFIEEEGKLRQRFVSALESALKERGLDNDKVAVRVRDGKEGVIRIVRGFGFMGYDASFYPLTKSGEVSKLSSGYLWDFDEFKPKGGD